MHSGNCLRQKSSLRAKISGGGEYDEKKNICIVQFISPEDT